MTDKFDFKKEFKELYMPKTKPMIIDVPEIIFIMIDGKGNPNTCKEYKNAMEVLYGLSYSIKMSKMSGTQPDGYFEYVVPPLEGLWWTNGERFDGIHIKNKDEFCWTSMIRQPNFVTVEVFETAKKVLTKKKPNLDLSLARLEVFNEGKCAQIMHIGSFDDEPSTIKVLEEFIVEAGYQNDISEKRKHHEIYLSDPRKVSSEKLKTVIRHPIV
ncbi:GyrI-like domain-containing protein [Clostridium oryzae]|uniref:GyrI-like small molecule binding domain-containing protein n=1 Tax=Clostridium oryzae TaxID=1450648 RepID=A0A1V4IN31_9CLOT|nr:GyrI-like domain-containing protein [Clostridium oryzae]OPJ61210.1 hypothetical protein CLORY_24220 [Clostridium oryzae]